MTRECYIWMRVDALHNTCCTWPLRVTHDKWMLRTTHECYTWQMSVTQDTLFYQKSLIFYQKRPTFMEEATTNECNARHMSVTSHSYVTLICRTMSRYAFICNAFTCRFAFMCLVLCGVVCVWCCAVWWYAYMHIILLKEPYFLWKETYSRYM